MDTYNYLLKCLRDAETDTERLYYERRLKRVQFEDIEWKFPVRADEPPPYRPPLAGERRWQGRLNRREPGAVYLRRKHFDDHGDLPH